MRLRDLPAWKPIWYGDDLSVYVEGEIGILTDVINVGGRALSLMITYDGREYNGWVAADSPIIEALFPPIKNLVGRPIAEVADVEIPTISAKTLKSASQPQRNPDEKQPPESSRDVVSLPQQFTNDSAIRELWLQSLLASIHLGGTAEYEPQIGQISTMQSLTEKERALIREIFITGFEQALKEGRDTTAWTYQCWTQRLILRKPFNDIAFPGAAGYGKIDRADDDAVAIAGTTPTPLSEPRQDVGPKSGQSQSLKFISAGGVFCLMLVASFLLGRNFSQRDSLNEQPEISQRQSPSAEERSPINRTAESFSQTDAKRGPGVGSASRSGDQEKVSRQPLTASTNARRPMEEKTRKFLPLYKVRHNLPLRARPRFSSPAVDTVIRGATVKVLGFQGDWLNIQLTSERRSGFIRKEFAVPIAKTDRS